MPSRSRTPGKRHAPDPNLPAGRIVRQATGPEPKKPARRVKTLPTVEKPQDSQPGEQGRRGAVTGRKARAQKLSANQRRGIARRAARARWS